MYAVPWPNVVSTWVYTQHRAAAQAEMAGCWSAESSAEGRWSCRLSAQLSGRLLVQVGCIKDTLSLKQGGNTQLYPKFYAVDECLPHAFRGDRAVADCCCRNFRLNIRIAGARMNRRSLPVASMASSSPSAHPTTPSILSHTLGKMPRPWTQVLATRL